MQTLRSLKAGAFGRFSKAPRQIGPCDACWGLGDSLTRFWLRQQDWVSTPHLNMLLR